MLPERAFSRRRKGEEIVLAEKEGENAFRPPNFPFFPARNGSNTHLLLCEVWAGAELSLGEDPALWKLIFLRDLEGKSPLHKVHQERDWGCAMGLAGCHGLR